MAFARLPANTRRKRLAGGRTAYYWELPPWARPSRDPATGAMVPAMRHGRACALTNTPLGSILAEAARRADNLNEALAEWRLGTVETTLVKGSVAWLFNWYRQQERFTKLSAKTRADYAKLMEMLAAFPTKDGKSTFGKQMAVRVEAPAADSLYQRLKALKGKRQAAYAMAVCKLVWNQARRPGYSRQTGVVANPFIGMGVDSTTAKGNRATSREEYSAYRDAARALGFQSMATAAALAFEACQRVWDVFGFDGPDPADKGKGADRAIRWEGYAPGRTISLTQGKTGNRVTLPLMAEIEGEAVPLYPELEAELALLRGDPPKTTGPIVVEERNGRPYSERRMSSVHRKICDKAGLPKEMTFTGFRHGGITEIGNAGVADVRAVSGHKTLQVTGIYNQANQTKALQIASARRAHIALIEADEASGTE